MSSNYFVYLPQYVKLHDESYCRNKQSLMENEMNETYVVDGKSKMLFTFIDSFFY